MLKKILLGLFVVALLLCCVWGYMFLKKQVAVEQSNVFNFVAKDAVAHVRLNHPGLLCQSSDEKSTFFDLVYGNDTFLGALIPDLISSEIDSSFVIRRNNIFILSSAFVDKDNKLDIVHFVPLKKDIKIDNLLQQMAKKPRADEQDSKDYSYCEIDGLEFYACKFENFLALSSSSSAIDKNLQQVRLGQTLASDNLFVDGLKAAGRYVESNIFINSRQLSALINASMFGNVADKFSGFLSNLARWFILDVSSAKNFCSLNGFIYVNDQNVLNLIKTQTQAESKTLKHISSESQMAYSMQISNIDSLLNAYNKFFPHNVEDHKRKIEQISDSIFMDVTDFIRNLYPEEITLSYNEKQGWLTILRVANGKNASEEIKKLPSNFSFANIIAPLFGDIFAINKGKALSVVGDFIVVSSKPIATLNGSGVLSKNSDYIANEALSVFYATPLGLSKLMGVNNTNKKYNFRSILVQILPNDRSFYVNANILLSSQPKKVADIKEDQPEITNKENEVIENISKSSKAIVVRQIITSPIDNQRYIAVQYDDNTFEVYTFGAKLLFSTLLKEKIESDITILNPHNRGVACLLFNTENRVYLMDLGAKHMSGFPVLLPASATNGVKAYAYDRNADYRIFIACANKRIYLYGLTGQSIAGWKSPKTEGIVQRSIQFFRLDGKDYLIASDNNKLYVLTRRGNDRISIKEQIQIPLNAEFVGLEKPSRIRATDKSGAEITINLINGKVERK